MRRLRVGYILDDVDQNGAVYDFLRQSTAAMYYSVDLLIVQHAPPAAAEPGTAAGSGSAPRQRRRRRIEEAGVDWIERTESAIARRNPTFAKFLERHAVTAIDIKKRYVTTIPAADGSAHTYSDADLQLIRAHQLDLLIHGGSGRLSGDILSSASLGTVALCYVNERGNRDAPAGFWEVYRREPSTGFGLQRLLPGGQTSELLLRGTVATAPRWISNRVRQQLKAYTLLHLALDKIAASGRLPPALPLGPRDRPSNPTPSIRDQWRYLTQIAGHRIRRQWNNSQRITTRWGVAYQFVADWRNAELWQCREIANPPNHFLADPFVVRHDGRHVCYVEDYDYGSRKGAITAYEIGPDGYAPLGVVLNEDFHLSYPFVFRDDGELYMCPETHEANDIRLYKCTNFPLEWRLHRVLMKGVDAADTNVFKWKERWWLLTSIENSCLGDHTSELHLFHADRCDATQWTPHPQNPVVFDSRKARNGGLLFDGDAIYRVFQSQGFDRYGAAMGIARITELTPSRYQEEVLWTIPPSFLPGIDGTHTYSFADGLLAVDFVRQQRPGE